MKKKISLILVVVMIFANVLSVYSKESDLVLNTGQANALHELGLFLGTAKGYELEKTLSRAEAITMIVRLIGMEDFALSNKHSCPFNDLPEWSKPYVSFAYENGLTNGISKTKFGSEQRVSQNQFLTMLLRNLGYNDSAEEFDWKNPYALAYKVGLIKSVNQSDDFIRNDMVNVCVNALYVTYKFSSKTIYKDLIEKKAISKDDFLEISKQLGFVIDSEIELEINDNMPLPGGITGGFPIIEEPSKFTVRFLDVNNKVIDQSTVKSGGNVKIPDYKVDKDTVFLGWKGKVYNITSNGIVTPMVANANSKNIFLLEVGKVNERGNLTATVKLVGDVNVSGFDMKLVYNDKLKFVSLDNNKDFSIVTDSKTDERVILFNFAGISNRTQDSEVLTVEFSTNGAQGDIMDLQLIANDVIAIDTAKDYKVVNVDFMTSRFTDNIE